MKRWLVIGIVLVLAHFAASYVVPLWKRDQGALGGVLRWVWPWGVGDHGPLGELATDRVPFAGLVLAGIASVLLVMGGLAVLGVWVPTDWWRFLVIAGAAAELVLMVLFIGPTKLIPIAVDLAVIIGAGVRWSVLRFAT